MDMIRTSEEILLKKTIMDTQLIPSILATKETSIPVLQCPVDSTWTRWEQFIEELEEEPVTIITHLDIIIA